MAKDDSVDIFLNENYKVLNLMYGHECDIGGKKICPLTQKEIAEMMDLNIMTINKIIKKLKSSDYIEPYNNSKGRYVLKDKAYRFIKTINNI
jgi:DNA-binding MarR family transcriptional regulator